MGTMPCWGVVAVIAAMVVVAGVAEAQTARDCTSAYPYLAACQSYVSNNETTPPTQCCSGIRYLSTSDVECLCQIVNQFNTSNTPGVNATKAFALPSQCGITVDPAKCPALALAPGAAVAPTPPSSVAPPPPGGSASAPSTSAGAPPTDLFVAFTALLSASHLVWHALTAT